MAWRGGRISMQHSANRIHSRGQVRKTSPTYYIVNVMLCHSIVSIVSILYVVIAYYSIL